MITSGMVVFYIANVLAYATSARLAPARRLLLALRDAGERAEARTTPPPLFGIFEIYEEVIKVIGAVEAQREAKRISGGR